MPTDADNVEYAVDCFVVMRYSVVVVAEGCCCCGGMLLLLLRVYISMRLFACIKETTRSLLDEKSTKETMAHTTPPFPPLLYHCSVQVLLCSLPYTFHTTQKICVFWQQLSVPHFLPHRHMLRAAAPTPLLPSCWSFTPI